MCCSDNKEDKEEEKQNAKKKSARRQTRREVDARFSKFFPILLESRSSPWRLEDSPRTHPSPLKNSHPSRRKNSRKNDAKRPFAPPQNGRKKPASVGTRSRTRNTWSVRTTRRTRTRTKRKAAKGVSSDWMFLFIRNNFALVCVTYISIKYHQSSLLFVLERAHLLLFTKTRGLFHPRDEEARERSFPFASTFATQPAKSEIRNDIRRRFNASSRRRRGEETHSKYRKKNRLELPTDPK